MQYNPWQNSVPFHYRILSTSLVIVLTGFIVPEGLADSGSNRTHEELAEQKYSITTRKTSAPVDIQHGDQTSIRIGVLANRGYEACLQEWGPTAAYLSERLAPLNFSIVPLNFEELVPAVRQAEVDFVAANSSYYAYLEHHGFARRIVTLQVPGPLGPQARFGGVILTLSERNDINDLRDLRGKGFAAVSERSLGGWHAALRELRDAGIRPDRDFGALVFSGTHDAVVDAVLRGKVDAGTVRSTQLERMARESLLEMADIKVIGSHKDDFPEYPYLLSSRLYPEWPLAALPGTDSGLIKQVAVALLQMEEHHEAALALRGAGWATPEDYTAVHELLRDLRLPPYEYYGQITAYQAFKKFWPWLGGALLLLVLLWGLNLRFALLNRRLQISEERLAATLCSMGDGVISCDQAGNVLSLNHAAEALTGWTQEKAVGRPINEVFRIVDTDTRKPVNNPVFRALAEGMQIIPTHHSALIGRDGTERRVAESYAPIRDTAGSVIGVVLVFRDVTEECRQRAELDQAKRQTEQFFNQSLHGFFICMLDEPVEWNDKVDRSQILEYALDHQRMTRVNQAMLDQYGATEAEFIGITVRELLEHDLDHARQILQGIFERGQWHTETHERKMDGTPMVIDGEYTCLYDERGRVTGHFGVQMEVTDRKRAELELLETNRALEEATARANEMAVQAEAANMAKSAFLANMSHEIRTPLNGVLGLTELLLDTELDDGQRQYAEMVQSSGESLLTVINDILDFSKIESGKMELETLEFNLRATLNDVSAMTQCKAREKNLQFHCSVDPSVPSGLLGDPTRLRQVLLNLVGNAIKFTEEGQVAVRVTEEGMKDEGGRMKDVIDRSCILRFSVTDTGIGIPLDKQDRLFHQFSQVDSSTTRKFGGTGLGLAISKQLVELMGGQIGVNSPSVSSRAEGTGKGSEFWFTVPLGVAAVQPDDQLEETPDRPLENRFADCSVRLLLAEDDDTNRAVALGILEKLGIRNVDVSANGREALSAVQTNTYDLVLMDVQMPGMDGLEATRRIREGSISNIQQGMSNVQGKEHRSPRLPIIAMTAHAMEGDRGKCIAAGMDDYVSKPIVPESLAAALERWLPAGKDEGGRLGEKDEGGRMKDEEESIANIQQGKKSLSRSLSHSEDGKDDDREKDRDDDGGETKIGTRIGTKKVVDKARGTETAVWDRDGMLRRLMGDEGLLATILRGFLSDLPSRMEALRECLEAGDADGAERHAHTIKGAAANVGAEALKNVALTMEKACASGNMESARRKMEAFEIFKKTCSVTTD